MGDSENLAINLIVITNITRHFASYFKLFNFRRICTGSNDATIRLWDSECGSFLGSFDRHQLPVLDLVTSKTFPY
jgi:WD40 repeat protein